MQYNEIAVAKALVRETTAVQELDGVTLDCGEDELRQYVERLGLTGISVLDANGRLVCEYSADSIGYTRLQTDLEVERVLAVIGHPQSTYVRRVQLTDGSFADAAVRSCADGRGAVLGWRHTGAAFAKEIRALRAESARRLRRRDHGNRAPVGWQSRNCVGRAVPHRYGYHGK